MVFHKARNFALSIAATALVFVSAGAYADDTEIFLGNPSNRLGAQHHADPGHLGEHGVEHDLANPLRPARDLYRHRRLREHR